MPRRTTRRSKRDSQPPTSTPQHRAVIYARVSSKDQEREGFSIPAQQRLLRNYADQYGLHVVHEYVDVETAKRAGRTNFAKMLTWLKKNERTCRVVLVEKTDRLYRNLKDWVNLDGLDLEIHLVKEGVILSDDSRSTEKFMHGIRVLMAKNYIDNLSEEATKGMKEKARQGIWPSSAPMGYRNTVREDGKKIIEPDPERAPLIAKVFEWASTGDYSLSVLRKMAHDAGLATRRSKKPIQRSTLHRMLHNPIYMGEFDWAGERYQGTHAPIVTRERWERVQVVLADNYQHQRDTKRAQEFAFVGLVTCGHCGCSLSAQIKKERYVYYHCSGFKGKCPEPYLREEKLAEHFSKALLALHLEDEMLDYLKDTLRASHEDQVEYHQHAVQQLEAECGRIQRRLDTMYVDKLDGLIDARTFQRHSETWRQDLRKHRSTIARQEDANRNYIEEGIMLLELAQQAHELFDEQTPEQKRRLLHHVLSNSSWANGKLEVEYRVPFSHIAESKNSMIGKPPSGSDSGGGLSTMVGVSGFEPPTSCSRSRRANQAALHPEAHHD
jgi:site-specific DNA recombinase